jgi:hypothetical protein
VSHPKEKAMFYKYFCSSHIPKEKKENKTEQINKKHLQPKLVVPCDGPRALQNIPEDWSLWARKAKSAQSCPSLVAGFLGQPGRQHVALQGLRMPGYF